MIEIAFKNKPVVFLHLHKCAGTYLINRALNSGFNFPKFHINGNIIDRETSQPILFSGKRKVFKLMRRKYFSKPGDFVAMEWDFPIKFLKEIKDEINIICVVRDPLERAISNFYYDLKHSYTEFDNFEKYIDNKSFYTSNNFYTKIFSEKNPSLTVNDDDAKAAIKFLLSCDMLVKLGRDDLSSLLTNLGFNYSDNNRNSTEYITSDKINHTDIENFKNNNKEDYLIYDSI